MRDNLVFFKSKLFVCVCGEKKTGTKLKDVYFPISDFFAD